MFAEKVLSNKASAAATAARASFEKRCEACDKTYYSEGAYTNHLGSQKHRILAARLTAGTETESLVDSTFSLGEPIDTASTTTESTINGEANGEIDSRAAEEFDDVVEHMKQTGLEDTPADPLSTRPSRPTHSAAGQQSQDHPMSEEDEYEHKADLSMYTHGHISESTSFLRCTVYSSGAPQTVDTSEIFADHYSVIDQCLFCNYKSPTLDLNLNHMSKQHGFFIPEREYLVDLEGLVNYLSETIQVLHQCLFCHKNLHTGSGVQTHMRDRGHCMIAYTTEEEQMDVGDFYDFRSTYSDEETEGEEDEEVNGGVSLGVKRAVKTTVQNGDGEDVEMEDDEEGWESDSTLSSVPTDEITSVPIEHQDHKFAKLDLHKHHSHTDPRPHKNTDGFHSHAHHTPHAVYHDDYELHLPSGRTAGHRSLKTYYRQNLRNYPTAEERIQQRMLEDGRHDSDADDEDTSTSDATSPVQSGHDRGRQVMSRANGGLGMIGVSDAKKREVRAVEKRDTKRAQRAQNRYQAGNERRNNFQKHFRDPLLQ